MFAEPVGGQPRHFARGGVTMRRVFAEAAGDDALERFGSRGQGDSANALGTLGHKPGNR
jgi:hypothetical protein